MQKNTKTLVFAVIDGPVFPGAELAIRQPNGDAAPVLFHIEQELMNADLRRTKTAQDLVDRYLLPSVWPIANRLKEVS